MFTLLFVAFLLIDVAVRLWLATRQIRHVARNREQVPAEFSHRIGLTSHQRAADYTVARVRLGMLERTYDAIVLVGLTLLGGLQAIDLAVGQLTSNDFLRQMLLLVTVALLLGLLGLPFTLWRQFRLEARFGFNRMTPGLFVADALKGLLVAAVLGLPLAAAVLWLMGSAGAYWWAWAWGLWMVFNLALLIIYPMFIAPLFNKFTPLTDPDLAGRIQRLAQRCGFALNGLFVMDGSRRSAHGNAYFTGFGRSRRIVFFDTLLARLNGDEIEAVLAHELGHFAKRHIIKRICFSFGAALVFFALLGWISQQPWFYGTGRAAAAGRPQRRHGAAAVLPGDSGLHLRVHAAGQLVLAPRRIRGRPLCRRAKLAGSTGIRPGQTLRRQRRHPDARSRALRLLRQPSSAAVRIRHLMAPAA